MTRTNVEAMEAWRQVRPLFNMHYSLFPLKVWTAVRKDEKTGEVVQMGKTPLHGGWRTRDYSEWDWTWWLRQGGNIGIRARAEDLIIDVDPRNGGVSSYAALVAALGRDPAAGAMYVASGRGDGGQHYYMAKPSDLLIRKTLLEYPGLDFISQGFYVVAPGSTHPSTGGMYRMHMTRSGPNPIAAPPALLDLLKRPPPEPRVGDGGEVTNEDLAMLLACLNPKDFRSYDDWIAISAACHDATDGHGFREWADWCLRDPEYADVSDERLEHHWDSFEVGKKAGSTYRTLLHHVIQAGHGDVVKKVGRVYSASDEFDDDIEDYL